MPEFQTRGLLSPKSYVDVLAEPRKFDFLYTNCLPNYPPIGIPVSIDKQLILPKLAAFYNNLLKIHPIFEFGLFYLWWNPPIAKPNFAKKHTKRQPHNTYTKSMREPQPQDFKWDGNGFCYL